MDSFRHAQTDATGRFFLRLAVGGLMLFHGIWKLWTGVDWLSTILIDMGLPGYTAYGVYIAEIVAPLLILMGSLTRTASLIVALDMLVAILLMRRGDFFALNLKSGGWSVEVEVFFFFAALARGRGGGKKFRLSAFPEIFLHPCGFVPHEKSG